MTKTVKSFRLDAPTREAVRIMAEWEKRSEAQIIQFAVEEYFKNHYEAELMKRVNVAQPATATGYDEDGG